VGQLGPLARHARQRLTSPHVELQTGEPAVVIGLLTDMIGEYPLVDPLVALLMRALCATGHSARAFAHYTAIRGDWLRSLAWAARPGPQRRSGVRARA
jgi:hypothetical protein